jgi:glutamate 5-kinase
LLALELKADLLILLSDVEGLYTGPPSDPKSQLIHTYLKEEVTFGEKSRVGRGGMTAKVNAAWQAASAGIPVVISRFTSQNSLLQLQFRLKTESYNSLQAFLKSESFLANNVVFGGKWVCFRWPAAGYARRPHWYPLSQRCTSFN